MIRLMFSFLLLVHGGLHLLGFTQAYRLKATSPPNGNTLIPVSAAFTNVMHWGWLLACGLFVLTAVYLVQKKDGWWMPGMVALLLSQALIILYWPDAKFGTLVNGMIVILIYRLSS
jgi:hypothetical protein